MNRHRIRTAIFAALATTLLAGMGGGGDGGGSSSSEPYFAPPSQKPSAVAAQPRPRAPAIPAAEKACAERDAATKECRKLKR